MKAIKILVVLLVILVALIAAGLFAVFYYIDSIAKQGVERGATYALGVETTLDSADVGVFGGTFDMNGLKVANPSGFKETSFLTLGDGSVAVDLGTLRQQTVTMPTLHLTDLDMSLERSQGKSNYGVILENLRRLESGEKPEKAPGNQKTFIVNEILIRDISVKVDMLPVGGEATRLTVPIEEIRLTDVSSADGLPIAELTDIIIKAVMEAVVAKAGDVIPAELLNDLQGQLAQLESLRDMGIDAVAKLEAGDIAGAATQVGEALGGDAQKAIDETKDKVEGAKEEAEQRLRDAEEGIRGLIPGRRDGGGG